MLSAGAAATAVLGRARAASDNAPVVLELFTSQGCSSCPPADALLAELSRRSDVMALSLHVDYWDYLGWSDTLGSPECSERQRAYAARLGDGQVYTPQMVIDGREQMVGSHRQAILGAIDRQTAGQGARVPMTVAARNGELLVEVAAAPDERLRQGATVWVVTVAPQIDVEIKRGENAGRTITYTNVVRRFAPAGMWHGEPMALSLPKSAVVGDSRTCAALLQADGTGPILGAAWMSGGGA